MSKVQQWKDKGHLDLRWVNWTLLNRMWNNEVPVTETACKWVKSLNKGNCFLSPFPSWSLALLCLFSTQWCILLTLAFLLALLALRAYTRQSFTFHLLSFCSYCSPMNSVWYFNLPRQREVLTLCLFPLRLYVNFLKKKKKNTVK